MSIIFHIDVNSAFLSWSAIKLLEEGYPQDIRTIPAVIGGDRQTRHGIVVAKSIPAKQYKIKTAETIASALQKCPNLLVIPPEHAYYRTMSHNLMEHLASFCPILEQVSIDECYMLYDPMAIRFSSPQEAAYHIKDSVKKTFGFTVNVGISDRKVLSKMASDFEKPDKVHTLYESEIQQKMWHLPIGDLYMCGKSARQEFLTKGIKTIGDLAKTDVSLIESWMKSHGVMLWEFANGIDSSTVNPVREKAKNVGNSTTVAKDVTKRSEAVKILSELATSVARRLHKQNVRAGVVCVEIKYATFESASHQKGMEIATNDKDKILSAACELFDELWTQEPIRLLGIRTSKLTDASEPQQMNLFDYREECIKDEKQKKLDVAMDKIRNKYGKDAISKGI